MMSISIVNPCFQDQPPTRQVATSRVDFLTKPLSNIKMIGSQISGNDFPTKLEASEPLPDPKALLKKLENSQVQTESNLDLSQKARTFLQVFLQFIQQTFCFLITSLSLSR